MALDSKTILLNIGNGFDLEIGLQSSIENFVDWIQQQNSPQNKEFNKFFCDFELEMHTGALMTMLKDKRWFLYEYVKNVDIVKNGGNFVNIPSSRVVLIKTPENRYKIPKNWYDVETIILKLVQQKQERLSLEQINFFESKFKDFLLKQIDEYKNTKKIDELFKKIDELFKKIEVDVKNNSNYILNFNYTSIKRNFYDQSTKNKFIENNVHGTLDKEKNIIFGISKEELSIDDENKFQFCKTFRKLLLEDEVKELPDCVNVIAFYGHSLNNQDSNYFFAQFDKYDIYNDTSKHKVKLVFYEKEGFPIHDNVFNLLKRYEERINNKNVIQRLQLENRLLIKKIT